MHQHYEQLKTAISSTPGQPDPELRLVNKDLVPHLRNAVVEYYHWQKKRVRESTIHGQHLYSCVFVCERNMF